MRSMVQRLEGISAKNSLALIPVKSKTIKWENKDNGLIELLLPRDGLMDRLVRLFKDTPEVMRVQLDDLGTYVWQAVDGSRTIEDIGLLLKAEFGDKAEPVYERLIVFLQLLKNNGFISY
ncbi:MAG: PqqD family protein [Clostridiales bacterium]|jgi:hypothetical protein|nr:PqqD family protein [Clostridiales bacterium]